ncbi:MAG TPA: class I poly(R)-hydroxyalkanoic acid synthase [Sphingomonadaceae bacterium]|nr:class I poly(R)-hydroxyalkanoic acid synthase [Sphingomonadaceae bacterium]
MSRSEAENRAPELGTPPLPSLEAMQHWTGVLGRVQQMMLEAMADVAGGGAAARPAGAIEGIVEAQADFWKESVALWQRLLTPEAPATDLAAVADKDRRFNAAPWRDNPVFDLLRQSYLLLSEHVLRSVEAIDGLDERQRERLRFTARAMTDAASPSNFILTNPLVMEKAIETGGASLLKGLEHLLADLGRGQLTHVDRDAFEVGRNIATTPGKVIRETPLYQLIQYAPATGTVYETPLVIFPPWINRFYILDLSPEKSFVHWAVAQGLTVFMVSWKSADESLAGTTMDDYVLNGELDAIEAVRALLGVPAVHAIGYCVAGTNLAALLARLAATGEADKVASATFFAAQVDFAKAGELTLFVDDAQAGLIRGLAGEAGYLDGRYMAATFNLLRARDLIWTYVVNHYLLGEPYRPFDLLFWNGDTTNLPVAWHLSYLRDLYRDNRLVQPGGLRVGDVPIDLRRVTTPSYVQAAREDHIAPAESVWEVTRHFTGPLRFVLADSGHIAGVINPPDAHKYRYWTHEAPAESFAAFVDRAEETPGSWWPDWLRWVTALAPARIPAAGARQPGEGALPAIEDAPGRYVKMR